MLTIYIIVASMIYVIIAVLMSAWIAYDNYANKDSVFDSFEQSPMPLLSTILWPLTLIVWPIVAFTGKLHRIIRKIAKDD